MDTLGRCAQCKLEQHMACEGGHCICDFCIPYDLREEEMERARKINGAFHQGELPPK